MNEFTKLFIFPIRNSKSKLRATANVNIAGAFAVRGFRIFDSKKGLFVKEPEQSYVKEGTELTHSVFFPVTKEAREPCMGRSSIPMSWSWRRR